ncbi:MAG: amino acid ABC transporter substrate-binding protein, partial [Ruminococcaceae bacterium]|nr:amino acid ABC transporter substrate-binding protein [Oscillospiraceae bacterium]
MKFTKIICLAMVALLSVGLLVSCGDADYTAKNETFKIGVSGPLTGDAAIYGEAVRNAAQMAVDEINENGGLDGVKFELIATDDKHDPANVATNFSSMLEKGMQVSLGTVTTAPGLEYKPLANEENVFFLTPSASGDDIPGGTGYQMCFADGNQGKVAASYVNENCKDEKVGIFYKSDDPYSK